jgi:hypothetical protein
MNLCQAADYILFVFYPQQPGKDGFINLGDRSEWDRSSVARPADDDVYTIVSRVYPMNTGRTSWCMELGRPSGR